VAAPPPARGTNPERLLLLLLLLLLGQVVLRDPLRRSEGWAPEGYSAAELCLLSRSSDHRQRAAALRMLAALLAAARPTFQDVTAARGLLPRPVAVPAEVVKGWAAPRTQCMSAL
jgi:hypothetical protein